MQFAKNGWVRILRGCPWLVEEFGCIGFAGIKQNMDAWRRSLSPRDIVVRVFYFSISMGAFRIFNRNDIRIYYIRARSTPGWSAKDTKLITCCAFRKCNISEKCECYEMSFAKTGSRYSRERAPIGFLLKQFRQTHS